MTADAVVSVEGRELELTNLDKVLYPEAGWTKAHVIDYYTRVAPAMLPHLAGRPITLKRYPNGVDGHFFYEKNCPSHAPDWVATLPVYSDRKGENTNYCVVDGLPTLVWIANLASLEIHASLSSAADVLCPTAVAFDLDPGAPADVVQCSEVAMRLKVVFDELDLAAYPKTSGSKGLQVYVPLNTPATYEGAGGTKPFARAIAQLLERQDPALVTSNMKKDLRKGKVFVDWSQNDDHKTTVCVYSLRAKARPTVSTPVAWDEVEKCRDREDAELLRFEADEVLARVAKHGDLFADVATKKQKLPKL